MVKFLRTRASWNKTTRAYAHIAKVLTDYNFSQDAQDAFTALIQCHRVARICILKEMQEKQKTEAQELRDMEAEDLLFGPNFGPPSTNTSDAEGAMPVLPLAGVPAVPEPSKGNGKGPPIRVPQVQGRLSRWFRRTRTTTTTTTETELVINGGDEDVN